MYIVYLGLAQLCAILESRQSLRKCGVYFVIREMDKSEPDAEISQVGHGGNRAVSNHVLQSLAWSQRRRAFESPRRGLMLVLMAGPHLTEARAAAS